jgi:type IV pilus assembly protein PilV
MTRRLKPPPTRRASSQRGVALIEVLVTLVILLIGLLGLAGVSNRASVAEMESYQRIQALELVQDMANRINANRKVASCYSNGTTGVQLGGSSTTIPTCTATGSSTQQQTQAVADLTAWRDMINGESETMSVSGTTTKIGTMLGAVGCVTLDATDTIGGNTVNTYLIAVSWQGLANTAAPTKAGAAFPCGNGSYGTELLHRVVTTKVQIGVLTNPAGASS